LYISQNQFGVSMKWVSPTSSSGCFGDHSGWTKLGYPVLGWNEGCAVDIFIGWDYPFQSDAAGSTSFYAVAAGSVEALSSK
jgi:hypothetical protein